MKCLFLDLASHKGIIACVTSDDVAASISVDHRIGDHELLPKIEEVLKKAQWMWEDLTRVACVVGPGGFTSLRVAVACVNTIAWEKKIPVAGVHLSELCAARVEHVPSPAAGVHEPQLRERDFLWLHSTKKQQLFIRGFGDLMKKWPEPVLMTLETLEASRHELRATRYVGELIPEHEALVQKLGLTHTPLAELENMLPDFLRKLTYEQKQLIPWYGRQW